MDVLRGDIFEVDLIDFRAQVQVVFHPGRGDDIGEGQRRICRQLRGAAGLAGEPAAGSLRTSHGIDFLDPLHHLEQPGAAGYPCSFQRRRHRQADGLLSSGEIGHHQVGSQRVKATGHALGGGVITFQEKPNSAFCQ